MVLNIYIGVQNWRSESANALIKLQSFLYRLLHRIITCNHWLFIAKIKDTPSCKYCKLDYTIEHFFWHCTDVANFWRRLTTWWNRIVDEDWMFFLVLRAQYLHRSITWSSIVCQKVYPWHKVNIRATYIFCYIFGHIKATSQRSKGTSGSSIGHNQRVDAWNGCTIICK